MRHLLFILSEKPQVMEYPGLLLLLFSSLLQVLALLMGPVELGKFHIFDYHSHALLLMIGGVGTQIYLFGCSLYLLNNENPLRPTAFLLNMDESRLFFTLIVDFALCAGILAWLFFIWIQQNFGNLKLINPFLVMIHFILIIGFINIGMLGIHVLKKAK
jgi:hypothetical protein